MGADRLDRKTFSSYVCASREAGEDNSTGYIETVNKGPETVYYYVPGKNELTEEDIHIILDSLFAVKCISPEYKSVIKEKLLSQTNKYVKNGFELIKTETGSNNVNGKHKPYINQDVLNLVIEAVKSKRSIQFDYYWYTPNKDRIIRYSKIVAWPQTLIVNDGYYYLIAYNPMKAGKRYYRIDRMDNIIVADPIGEIPAKFRFNYTEFIYSNFNMFSGEIKQLVLKSEETLANQIIDKFGDYDVIEHKENWFSFKVKVEMGNTFYAWLCGFGGKIKIISPEEEVKAFSDFLDQLK